MKDALILLVLRHRFGGDNVSCTEQVNEFLFWERLTQCCTVYITPNLGLLIIIFVREREQGCFSIEHRGTKRQYRGLQAGA